MKTLLITTYLAVIIAMSAATIVERDGGWVLQEAR